MERRVKSVVRALHEEANVFFLVDDTELRHIASFLEEVRHPAGSVIFNEGYPPDYVAFVAGGRVEAKKRTEFQGSSFIVAQMSRGSILGELSFCDGRNRSATTVALEDTDLLFLTAEALERIARDHPETALKIYKGFSRVLSLRLRKLTERMACIF
jgi:CRP-like cAMP-binding protein